MAEHDDRTRRGDTVTDPGRFGRRRPHEHSDLARRRICAGITLGLARVAGGMALGACSPLGGRSATPGSALGEPSPELSQAMEPEAVRAALVRVADWQLALLSPYPSHDWSVAPFWAGLVSCAPLAPVPDLYLEAARANGRRNAWQPGPRPFCADDLAITQSYFMLYAIDRDRAQIEPALARFDALLSQPFDESLEFSHDTALRESVWCDALFMAPPALTLATRATGDRRYAALMERLWWKTTDYLYDRDARLYYRDSRFFGRRERNGANVFWSRGNGWVLAGLARVLQYLAADDPGRARLVALFQAMARALVALQGRDGYWRASLLDPADWSTPEVSGTAFFTYAVAWGVNAGVLERGRYEATVRRGWAALVRAVRPDGRLGYVQGPGDRPGETAPDHAEPYGTGAFLLAGTEVHQLALRPRHGALRPARDV